jgi:hypothetical protein
MFRSCTTMNGTLPLVITRRARLPVMNCMPRMPCVPMMISSAPSSEAVFPTSSYTEPTRTCARNSTALFHFLARSASIPTFTRASSSSDARDTMCRRSTMAPMRPASAAAWFMAQSATFVKSVGTSIRFFSMAPCLGLAAAKVGNVQRSAGDLAGDHIPVGQTPSNAY